MKIFKYIYYLVLAFIILIAVLLLISAFPIAGNYQVMMVQSGSMEPAIKMGSVVVVKPAEDYRIGDVVTFGPYDKIRPPTTHRVHDIKVEAGQPRYITKGDDNNAPDSGDIGKEDIIGKVIFSVPYLGYFVEFSQKPWGFALIIIVPALIIVGGEIKKIIAEIKKSKRKPTHIE